MIINTGASKPFVLAITSDSRVFTMEEMQPVTYCVFRLELTSGMARVRTNQPDMTIVRYKDQYISLKGAAVITGI